MMSTENFVIKKGRFLKYTGPEVEVLEIPEGVIEIAKYAYRWSAGLSKCKKIIVPASVKRIESYACEYANFEEIVFMGDIEYIGENAFYECGRNAGKKVFTVITFEGKVGTIDDSAFEHSRVKVINAHQGIEKLGKYVFYECPYLEEVIIPGLKSIGGSCFERCPKLSKIDIPENCTVGTDAFTGCRALGDEEGKFVFAGTLYDTRGTDNIPWTSIPDGVKTIDKYALKRKDHVTIPCSVTNIMKQYESVEFELADGYLQTDKKLTGTGFMKYFESDWSKSMSATDWAYVYLFQTGKKIEKILADSPKDVNGIVEGILVALEQYGKEEQYVRAAEYILANIDSVTPENIQKMYDFCVGKKSQKATSLLQPYLGESITADENDPYSEWRSVYAEHILDKCIKSNNGDKKLFANVKLAGSSELAPAFIVKCAVVPYLMQYTGRQKRIGGYRTDYMPVSIIENADRAADLLDKADLQKLVEKQYAICGPAWLLPLGRIASGARITSLLSEMRRWEEWYTYGASGRSDIITARGALMLSDTRESMMNLDKKGLLEDYARLRNSDADSIRDTVLAEFGLDKDGRKEYDLGSKKIVASLAQDLTLVLYDVAENKIVKSIPKKGTNPELVKIASADFADMKKNTKKVVKGRNDILFGDFLSGKTRSAVSWINSYTRNPLLKKIAELIVWNQGKATFILSDDGAIDCDGNPYEIDQKENIGVAHPLEMEKTEVEAWQKYFTSKGLKQPFSQIWEPVVDNSAIKEDRYAGCMIPFYRFRGQGKHGISVEDYDFHNQIDISFKGCDAFVERIDWHRHEINNDDNFEVQAFGFREYTRQTNHIVAYLDKITVYGRVLKDDTSIATYLDSFTLAQITEFINAAVENQCNNCLAVLMEYKNSKFSEYDPMDEFTLE